MSENRFITHENTVLDTATGLTWTLNAAVTFTGLPWLEALQFVSEMNKQNKFGKNDWRLPNRRELNSLIDYSEKQPAMPKGHPFQDVWKGWYWTSTTYAGATDYAWRVQFTGGRMFFGKKVEDSLVWPVRGSSEKLLQTGQTACFDVQGKTINCADSGQDGEIKAGISWDGSRFRKCDNGVEDLMTGLCWSRQASLTGKQVSWASAMKAVKDMARQSGERWRMPTIQELESLTDCSQFSPALPAEHPFIEVPEACWSSTTSGFDPDWVFCLYWKKGAVGVGYKTNEDFHVWAVKDSR
jgi:hypothetical protein